MAEARRARCLHVSVLPGVDLENVNFADKVEDVLSLCIDWIRYRDGVYVVYTRVEPKELARRLVRVAKGKGAQVFVAPLDVRDRGGIMTQGFWDWLKKRGPSS